jgi:plastocyanin
MRPSFSMMPCFVVAAGLWLAVTAVATAGTVRGQIRITNKPPRRETAPVEPAVARTNAAQYRDFVVFLESDTVTNFSPPLAPVIIQVRRDATDNSVFSPHILPVLAGTTVAWRNEDTVYHKLFSLSEVATFEFPLCRQGDEPQRWTFTKPGRVDVFCSIYANMSGTVLVLEYPWFTGTDYRNNYLIAKVPAGNYRLKVWHERLPLQTREITVPEDGEVRADFTYTLLHPGPAPGK